MLKIIYISIFISLFSCGEKNKKKERVDDIKASNQKVVLKEKVLLDDKQEIIKSFFDLFDNDFVSITNFETFFGSYLVEEEELFFQECEKNNDIEHCNETFDNCLKDKSKCESKVFLKIKEQESVKDILLKQNRIIILQNIKKIDDYNYTSTFENNTYTFNFTSSEERKMVINRLSINGNSIFKDLF